MFMKPRRCDNSAPNCVEVEVTDSGVRVRDSKLGEDSPVLEFTHDEWETFRASVRDGEFATA